MLSHGGSGKEGKDDETDGDRLQSIPLPFGQPPSKSAGKQISDKDGELDLLLTRVARLPDSVAGSVGDTGNTLATPRATRVLCICYRSSATLSRRHKNHSGILRSAGTDKKTASLLVVPRKRPELQLLQE